MTVRICYDIQQSLEEVFSTVSNPTNLLQYDDNIIEVKTATQTEISVGTTYQLVAIQFGKRVVVNLEIIAYELNQEFTFRVNGGPFPVVTQYKFVGRDNTTMIIGRREPHPGGFGGCYCP